VKALALLAVLLMLCAFWVQLLGAGLKWGVAFALSVTATLLLVAILGSARQRDDGRTVLRGDWR
jgi:hypothetical protein